MITRRQMFRLLAGAAALAAVPTLPSGSQIAVADAAGGLLPMDGSWVSVAEFPELTKHLLAREKSHLEYLEQMSAYDWMPPERQAGYRRERAEYASIVSSDGMTVRLPRHYGLGDGQTQLPPSFHATGNGDGVWYRYDYFIQARPEPGAKVGTEFAVRNLV